MTTFIKNSFNSFTTKIAEYIPLDQNRDLSPPGPVAAGLRNANGAILGSLKSGLKTCFAPASYQYKKIESGMLGSETVGKCARAAKAAFLTFPTLARGVAATDLERLKRTLIEGVTGFLGLAAGIMTQRFFLNNLVPLLIEKKEVIDDESFSGFDFAAATIAGSAVTILASLALNEVLIRNRMNTPLTKVTGISAVVLTSSIIITLAESILTSTIGPKALKITPQLTACLSPALICSLIGLITYAPNVGRAAVGLTSTLFAPALVYALQEAFPLSIRLAILSAAAIQIATIESPSDNRGTNLLLNEPRLYSAIAGALMAGEAIYPGYIGPSLGCALFGALALPILKVHEDLPDIKPVFDKNTRKVEMQVVQSEVAKQLPKDLAAMIMDYFDETDFSRIKFPVVPPDQVEQNQAPAPEEAIRGLDMPD